MELLFLAWIAWGLAHEYWPRRRRKAITGRKWVVTFKGKRTPPMEVHADSLGLAVRELMRQKVDYQTVASVEPA